MLAIISFTLLGIWTLILGIINNCDFSISKEPSQKVKASIAAEPVRQQATIQEPASTTVQVELDNPSEIAKAFQNLWKQIIHGK